MPEKLTKMKPQTPDSDADVAADIEDEMRAQMLLGDPKMLENYLRIGFEAVLKRLPDFAQTIKERGGRVKDPTLLNEALVQETRLRLTNLAKSAPEQVDNTLKIVEIMIDQFQKRVGVLEKPKEQDRASRKLEGLLKKDIWDMMMDRAHQSKKE